MKVKRTLAEKSLQAYELLLMALNSDMLALVADCSMGDANAVWVTIERLQLKARSATDEVVLIKEQLATFKVEKKEGKMERVVDFLARIKAMMARLRQHGGVVDEHAVMLRFLKAMKKVKSQQMNYKLARRAFKRGQVRTLDDLALEFLEQDEGDESDSSDSDDDSSDGEELARTTKRALRVQEKAAQEVKQAAVVTAQQVAPMSVMSAWQRGGGPTQEEMAFFGGDQRGGVRGGMRGGFHGGFGGRGGSAQMRGGMSMSMAGRGGNVRCYSCGKLGHISYECPQGEVSLCYNCGGRGHVSKECPSKRGGKDSSKVAVVGSTKPEGQQ